MCISVESFVDWIANNNPTWAAYHEFVSGLLIPLEKNTGVLPVDVGETWRRLFSKCVLKVTGTKSTNACQDDQLQAELKEGIDRAIHSVKDIWYANSSTENLGFLLVNAKMRSTK